LTAAISVKGLSFRYAGRKRAALRGVTFEVPEGETLLVLGPSGCGKSTLALCLNGMIPHVVTGELGGSVRVHGQAVGARPLAETVRQVGIVFQDPESQLCMLRVDEEIAFGLENLAVPAAEMPRRIRQALDLTGLEGPGSTRIDWLSGGNKQRLALASVLAMEPSVLIFDEPTSNLDPAGARVVFATIERLRAAGRHTIVVIEHRLDQLMQLIDRVLVLGPDGALLDDGEPHQVLERQSATLDAFGIWKPQVSELADALGLRPYPITLEEAVAALSTKAAQSTLSPPTPLSLSQGEGGERKIPHKHSLSQGEGGERKIPHKHSPSQGEGGEWKIPHKHSLSQGEGGERKIPHKHSPSQGEGGERKIPHKHSLSQGEGGERKIPHKHSLSQGEEGAFTGDFQGGVAPLDPSGEKQFSPLSLRQGEGGRGGESGASVSIRGLTAAYGRGPEVLHDVHLDVPRGEILALVGPNGSGKSTLAHHLIATLRAPRGTVFLDDRDIRDISNAALAETVGYVFQNPEHQFVERTVFDELAYGPRLRGLSEAEVQAKVEALLDDFGLLGLAAANPFKLSHGEKRRLSVATMLILDQHVLVLDEPTFGQDRRHAAGLLDRFQALNSDGTTLIVITHDMRLVVEHARQVAVLKQGRLRAHRGVDELFDDPALLEEAHLEVPPMRALAQRLYGTRRGSHLPATVHEMVKCLAAQPVGVA
jgi:energy-coupling factor transporter ATP-binding protein EcfA2